MIDALRVTPGYSIENLHEDFPRKSFVTEEKSLVDDSGEEIASKYSIEDNEDERRIIEVAMKGNDVRVARDALVVNQFPQLLFPRAFFGLVGDDLDCEDSRAVSRCAVEGRLAWVGTGLEFLENG